MKSNYDTLGKYIQLVDTRNKDLAITNLLGVSIEKKFIPSIANIVGTDLSSYKVVRTGQFAYGPVTSRNGEKISIAYLDGEDFSDDMRKCHVGIALGADYRIGKRIGVYADITWGLNGAFKSSFKTIEQTLYPIYGTIGLTYKLK